jgi:hypothetical protein
LNLKKEEKNRAKKIQEFERLVQTLQTDLAKPTQVEDMSEIDEEMVCFLFSNCTSYKFCDRIASTKATTIRVIASLISKNNNAVSLTMNLELMLKWLNVKARMSWPITCFGHLRLLFNRLKRLDDDSYRKLQNLAQLDPDCAAVINWLRGNKHRFRMEIVEPAAISLTVPNKGYVHAVEACFNITQLKVRPLSTSLRGEQS